MLALLLVSLCAAPTSSVSASLERAREEYEIGVQLLRAKEYRAAHPRLLRAYELSHRRPNVTYNLAQCERALGLYYDSLVHYREYLRSNPKDAKDIEATMLAVGEVMRGGVRSRGTDEPTLAQPPRSPASPNPVEATIPAAEVVRSDLEPRSATERKQIDSTEGTCSILHGPCADTERASAPTEPEPVTTGVRPPPPEEDGGFLASPFFWIAVGLAAAGATAAVVASAVSDPYAGTTGVTFGE